jgi:hypothetical protein
MRLGDVKVKSQGGTNCVNNQRAIDLLEMIGVLRRASANDVVGVS